MKKIVSTIFATVVAVSAFALTPDEAAVKNFVDNMEVASQEGRLMTYLFDAMPTSHQKGFYDVSQAFAKKMDPDVWKSGTSFLKSVGKICATKSQFIVNSKTFANEFGGDSLSENKALKQTEVISSGKFISGIATISLADIKAQPNAKALATYLDSKIGKLPAFEMPTYTIKTEQDGDIVLYFKDRGKTWEFEKVKGKWLPKKLADPDFDDIIEDINEDFDFSSKEGQQAKFQFMMLCQIMNLFIEPLLNANTQEEFDLALLNLTTMSN